MNKMDPQVKETWIIALESGDYPQGRVELQNWAGEFCCLGVLCDLYDKAHPNAILRDTKGYGDKLHSLPYKVRAWSGVSAVGEFRLADGTRSSLATLNDEGVKFPDIANVIREHF